MIPSKDYKKSEKYVASSIISILTAMSARILLTHPGTQYAHRLACQLHRLGLLEQFITGIGFSVESRMLRAFPTSLRKKISNRILDCGIREDQIQRILLPELIALYKIRQGKDILNIMHVRNERFQKSISDKQVKNSEGLIGFDTSSWLLARKAKQFGKPFFLDQSTIHPNEKINVVNSLKAQFPDWFVELPEKPDELMKLEEEEHTLSTKIVVASTFTKNSLISQGVPAEKIVINPYGVSKNFFRERNTSKRKKLRFLYLGLMGPAKGLPLLLQLWNEYELHQKAELWLVGPTPTPFNLDLLKGPGITYKGKLPHDQLPPLLNDCDCMVFPSFFDGFGQVILEAMAAGLPVITTTATAGPDIIENGVDGFLVSPGDKKGLAACMLEALADRTRLEDMSIRAREKARMFNWDSYGDRWKNILAYL